MPKKEILSKELGYQVVSRGRVRCQKVRLVVIQFRHHTVGLKLRSMRTAITDSSSSSLSRFLEREDFVIAEESFFYHSVSAGGLGNMDMIKGIQAMLIRYSWRHLCAKRSSFCLFRNSWARSSK